MAMNLLGKPGGRFSFHPNGRARFRAAKETGRSYDPVSTISTSRMGPCAPCTNIFSMSAVRLEPLITQA
jgi:hypothetical protein